MTQLAEPLKRDYEENCNPMTNDLAADAADVFEGSAVGINGTGNGARQLVAADVFAGFAARSCYNAGGSIGAQNVLVQERGAVVLPVTGVADQGDYGAQVFASDGNAFSLTDGGTDTPIGAVRRFVESGVAVVYFEAKPLQLPIA